MKTEGAAQVILSVGGYGISFTHKNPPDVVVILHQGGFVKYMNFQKYHSNSMVAGGLVV